ncbi:MAG: PEP-CTERM sorting domain-containing protein [Thalassotalea sp.]|nr:PEP-CTERM sorting domain-containing protein [Thalassotalea sp.]
MSKLFKGLAVIALLYGSAAHATNIQIDPDGTDGKYDFINIDTLDMVANPGTINVAQYFGADGWLNDGDLFTESVTFDISSAKEGVIGDVVETFDTNNNNSELYIVFELTGHIENVRYLEIFADATAAFTSFGNDPAAYSAACVANLCEMPVVEAESVTLNDFNTLPNFNNLVYDVVFDTVGSTVQMWFDDDQDGDRSAGATASDSLVGEWLVTNGGASDVQVEPNATTASQLFEVGLDFVNNGDVDDYWKAPNGELISELIDFDLVVAVADASANPIGLGEIGTGEIFGDHGQDGFMFIESLQTNGSITFEVLPEPSSIAILGLGLLGLARIRRQA